MGFIIEKVSLDPSKEMRYEFRILERGFFSNGQLKYFGEIFYENGNYYFGRVQNQMMDGFGILVYNDQKRFVVGEFVDGKPLKLDENIAFRLDTEEGRALYMNIKKKIHK